MTSYSTSLQSRYLFERAAKAWRTLDPADFERLALPAFLQDQVFQIAFVPGPVLHCFEVRVAEQCPRDAYDHIARGLARLGPHAFAANMIHGRSANAHLIFWRVEQAHAFHHLDLDFANTSKADRAVMAHLKHPIPENVSRLFQQLEGAALGKSFLRTLRGYLQGVAWKRPAQYYGLVDLLLKLVFLIFVQRKGWLNFDPAYLANKMRACDGRGLSIITCFLKPLFARLEGLPIGEPMPLGSLPRLGGGMFAFQADVLPSIPNQWCLDLLQTLTAGYSFSLFEGRQNRHIVGVSPEVLGHVFENMLFPDDRKSQGTFYTPQWVAQNQVREALDAHFRHHPLVGDPAAQRRRLFALRLLDPSCGSGTYLLAAFTELLNRHLALAPQEERYNGKLYHLKRTIMLENLYGLDIHPMAVRLTEVRLWLNMIQDLEIGDPSAAPALPSLQHHIRPGDFLGQYQPITVRSDQKWPHFERLERLRERFPDSAPERRTVLLRQIYRLERQYHEHLLEHAAESERQSIREAMAQPCLPGVDLEVGDVLPRPEPVNRQLHVMFSGVLTDEGFDCIIGNPPWLSGARLSARHKRRIRKALVPPAGLRLSGQPDLSLYFFVAALRWLKPGGHLSFLLPGKVLQAEFAQSLRAWLQRYTTINYLLDDGIDQGLIFAADTFPLGIGISLHQPREQGLVRIRRRGRDLDETFALAQANLSPRDGVWALLKPSQAQPFQRRRDWPRLGDLHLSIQRGVVTHAKKQFVFDSPPEHLPKNDVWPLLRGRDIQVGAVAAGAWIYWPFSAGPRWSEQLQPKVASWLDGCEKVKQRGPLRALPYAPKKFGPWCVIWKYLSARWTVALRRANRWVPDQTTYFINTPDFETGWRLYRYFNSQTAQEELQWIAERGKDRCFFFYAHTCRRLPVPPDLLTKPMVIPDAGDCAPPTEPWQCWVAAHVA